MKTSSNKVSPVVATNSLPKVLLACHLEKDVFKLPRLMFQFSAMWSFDYDKILPQPLMFLAPILDFLYRGFINLNTLHITILCATTTVAKISEGFDAMSIFVLNFVIYGWINIAAGFYAYHETKARALCDRIEKALVPRGAPGLTFVSMKSAIRKGKIVLSAWMAMTLVAGCSMASIPLFGGNRQLLLPLVYPFDPYQPVVFEIIYALQFLGQVHISGVFVMTCGYLYYCIFLICGQHDILCGNIKNIGYTALIKKGAGRQVLRYFQNAINLDPMNEFVLGSDIEEKEDLNLILGTEDPKCKLDFSLNQFHNLDNHLRDSILNCVKLHESILRICDEVELYFRPILFGKVADITLLLTFILYSLALSEDLKFKIGLSQYLNVASSELLVLSYLTNLIATMSPNIVFALINSPWHEYSLPIRKEILIVLSRSMKPFFFTAGKFLNVTIEMFFMLSRASFSYFTLLQKLRGR